MKNFTAIVTLGLLAFGVGQAFADEYVDDNFTKSPASFWDTIRTFPVAADFTNNDLMDVFYAGQWNAQWYFGDNSDYRWQTMSNLYVNNGDGTFTVDGHTFKAKDGEDGYEGVWSQHGVMGSSFNRYAVLDYNNDGNVDLLLWGKQEWDVFGFYNNLTQEQKDNGFLLLYKNNGDGTFTLEDKAEFPAAFPTLLNISDGNFSPFYNCIAVGDYDRDGYVDLLISYDNPSPGVKLYKNVDGTGKFEEQTLEGLDLAAAGNVHFADLDNDGWLDIVTDSQNQGKIYLNQNGTEFVEAKTSPSFELLRNSSSNIADFDGDGYLDYFMSGYGNIGFSSYLILNEKDGQYLFDEPLNHNDLQLRGEEQIQHIIRDFNNDGYPDVLYTTPKFGECYIYYGSAEGTFTQGDKELSNRVYVAAGDFNGNGLTDLFACGGNNKYERSNGGSWTHNPELFLNVNGKVTSPAAPQNVSYNLENGVLTISWDDVEGAAAKGLAYNVYLKKKDGSIATLVPANPKTGFVKVGEGRVVALRPGVTEYSLPCAEDDFESAGVQTISLYNETYSPFSVVSPQSDEEEEDGNGEVKDPEKNDPEQPEEPKDDENQPTDGVSSVNATAFRVLTNGDNIVVIGAEGNVTVVNTVGRVVATGKSGSAMHVGGKGLFIVTDGKHTAKVIK